MSISWKSMKTSYILTSIKNSKCWKLRKISTVLQVPLNICTYTLNKYLLQFVTTQQMHVWVHCGFTVGSVGKGKPTLIICRPQFCPLGPPIWFTIWIRLLIVYNVTYEPSRSLSPGTVWRLSRVSQSVYGGGVFLCTSFDPCATCMLVCMQQNHHLWLAASRLAWKWSDEQDSLMADSLAPVLRLRISNTTPYTFI